MRGQLARMIPQPDIHYGLFYNDVLFIPRRDGLVFQVFGEDDYYGFNGSQHRARIAPELNTPSLHRADL